VNLVGAINLNLVVAINLNLVGAINLKHCSKQDSQCTFNTILKHVCAIIVTVKRQ
jgi:hypothetical protein